MSSGEFDTPIGKGKWHFPAIYAGTALIISAVGIALYYNAPAIIVWQAVNSGQRVTYEEREGGRRVVVDPAAPQSASKEVVPPTVAEQAASKPAAPVVAVEETLPKTPQTELPKPAVRHPSATRNGTPQIAPPKRSKILLSGRLSSKPTPHGTIEIEEPVSIGERDPSEPLPKGAYFRDGMFWTLEKKKCEQHGDKPMEFLACHLKYGQRPVVRGW